MATFRVGPTNRGVVEFECDVAFGDSWVVIGECGFSTWHKWAQRKVQPQDSPTWNWERGACHVRGGPEDVGRCLRRRWGEHVRVGSGLKRSRFYRVKDVDNRRQKEVTREGEKNIGGNKESEIAYSKRGEEGALVGSSYGW